MKLVFVIRHFFPFTRPSGVTSFVRELSEELVRQGFQPVILCLKKKGEKSFYEFNGISIYKFNLLNFIFYREKIKSLNPDHVIHISSLSSGILLLVWWFILIKFTKGYRAVFFQTTNFHGLKLLPIAKIILHQYDEHMVTSSQLEKYFDQKFDLRPEKIFPGVNQDQLASYKTTQSQEVKKVGFFGHVGHVKGIDLFVALSKKCRGYKFHIVAGNGADTDRDKALMVDVIKQSNLSDNLEFTGTVDDPFVIMATCDILVLPYRTGGTVLGVAQSAIEAMAMGIPVIGTQNSALEDIIEDGVNGYFVRDLDEIELKLNQLRNDPEMYLRLSENARKTAESSFSIHNSTLNLLRKLQ